MPCHLHGQLQFTTDEHRLAHDSIHRQIVRRELGINRNVLRPNRGHDITCNTPHGLGQFEPLTQDQRLSSRVTMQRQKIVATHKGSNKPVGRPVIDHPRRIDLLHHAIEHHANLIRNGQCFFLVVCHIHRRNIEGLLQGADIPAQVHPQFGIQIGKRLIHQEHLGTDNQRPGQAHTLLLPAAQLMRHALCVFIQLHRRQDRRNPLAYFGGRHLLLNQAKGHVIEHAQVRKHCIVLEHHADVPLVRAQMSDRISFDQNLPGVLLMKTGDGSQQGGFPAPTRAKQGKERTAVDGQRHILQRHKGAIGFFDVFQFYVGHVRLIQKSGISPRKACSNPIRSSTRGRRQAHLPADACCLLISCSAEDRST